MNLAREWDPIAELLIGCRGMTEIRAAKVTFNELRYIERSEYRQQWERLDLVRIITHNAYLLTPCGKGTAKKMDRRDWMPLAGDDEFTERKLPERGTVVEEWEMAALAEIFGGNPKA